MTAHRNPWKLERLQTPPAIHAAPEFSEPGVQALYYDTLPWKGNSTRTFAWIGFPERRSDEKVPAVVLVHGGGGTAFADWVRLWTGRGYAAIAMDLCGCVSGGEHSNRPRHEQGGPPGYGGWDQMDDPVEDQWTFHAVADVILACSLLSARPEVDPNRIGLTGISWGGFVTCIVAGLDARFRFAVPVYGCGCYGEAENRRELFEQLGPERTSSWINHWDPANYLTDAHLPMLWINGTNDFAFPLNAHQLSYRLAPGPRTLSIPVRMPHAHGPGQSPVEIHAFAESILRDGLSLPRILSCREHDGSAQITWESAVPITRVELNCTRDGGPWIDRLWETSTVLTEQNRNEQSVRLPADVRAYYFSLIDERGLMVSSEMVVPE